MNWRNVRLIFLREVRDQLRDRRTLFMIAVLPLLLYPALGVGMFQMMILRNEHTQTVVVLGSNDLPSPQLIEGDRFISNWFDQPNESKRLRVVTEESLDAASPESHGELAERLDAAVSVKEAHREFERFREEYDVARQSGDSGEARRLKARMEAASRRRSELFSRSGVQVLMLVPEGMKRQLADANARIRDPQSVGSDVPIAKPVVLYNVADEKSFVAYQGVREVLHRWEQQLLRDRLKMANLPESLPNELDAKSIDLARPQERAASLWSKLFPVLLVLMTVTGAFYPAVDLAAGEKERGTMETLLICPASRAEIVLGKFLTVMLFSVSTALLNLASMGFTGNYVSSFGAGGANQLDFLGPPPLNFLFWIILLITPLAALFSALCLALATFARSSKEGQYYLTPILLVAIGLTMFCLMPTVEITPLYSILPVVGVTLLLKELLAGAGGYAYIAPVLVTSFGYAALALWWAIEQFSREEVLFREAERFELRLWLRHLLRDKEDYPSFAEAGVCFVLIILLQFGAMKVFADAASDGPIAEYGLRSLKLMLVQQLVIIATPAMLMGVILTRSVRKTFRLQLPRLHYFAIAVVLPLALMPLAATLAENLAWFFPPLPDSVVQTLRLMTSDNVSIGLTLLAFAVAPAFCEEIAFRGFILSGFMRSRRKWLAIGLSSLAFGIMHMIPQQVFNATLLGLVIGLLAVRSGSIWPGIVFHLIFNGSNVLQGRYVPQYSQEGYPWLLLVICAITAFMLIRWLVVSGQKRETSDLVKSDSSVHSAHAADLPAHVG